MTAYACTPCDVSVALKRFWYAAKTALARADFGLCQ